MLLLADRPTRTFSPLISDTLERMRITTEVSSQEWFDILQLSWSDYQNIKLGRALPSEKLTERIARHFNIKTQDLLSGKIDYKALALNSALSRSSMSEIYLKAAYGRRRTSINAVNFLERYAGWRLRFDAIRKLSVSENMLQDPFAPISMKFITDLCGYLHQRQFQKEDFYAMGAYTTEANRQTLIAELFAELPSAKAAYEFFFNDCMKLFEQNCNYIITQINDASLTVEYITNHDVAAESGVRHLGNTHVCQLKRGAIAHIPTYLGLPAARTKELACVHSGDDICRLELDFSDARKAQLDRLFSQSSLNH